MFAVRSNRPRDTRADGKATPVEMILPTGTTTADLISGLAELGAPQPFLEYAARFGDDVQALSVWLRDYGPVFFEGRWAADLLDHWSTLLEPETRAIDAEVFGYGFLAMYDELLTGPEGLESLQQLVSHAVSSGRAEALAMTRVLAYLGPVEMRPAATTASEVLIESGLPDPGWVRDLGSGDWLGAHGYIGPLDRPDVLALMFRLGGEPHCFALQIDPSSGGVRDCWSAGTISTLRLKPSFADAVTGMRKIDYPRGQAVSILTAALTAPISPRSHEQIGNVREYLPLLNSRRHLVSPGTNVTPMWPRTDPVAAEVRCMHRLKVSLLGVKPQIWRRLEVPSSTTLAELHHVLQVAFDWSESHLWKFGTDAGDVGIPGPDWVVRDADRITLSDVAPGVGSKLSYHYDFGDNWRHLITTEAVVLVDREAHLPQCTGGRRAAPPEDCGGPSGYRQLLEALADPSCEDHPRPLDWLDVGSGDHFDPTAFSTSAVNRSLRDLRSVLSI